MNNLMIYFYRLIPKSLRNTLGRQRFLKPLRDLFLKRDGHFKEGSVTVERSYSNYNSSFRFFASIKVASKAKESGIETRLLKNSIQLLERYKTDSKHKVIFDVGANFGYLSLVWATTLCKNGGNVIAFEPNRLVYDSFKKSVKHNQLESVISLHNLAVGNDNKTITLYLNNSTSNILETDPNLSSQEIKMITLDSFCDTHPIDHCDLIKIDVDGIELDILNGSRQLIERFSPLFIVETNDDRRILDFFKTYDYEILDIGLHPYQEADRLPANVFCIPKPK